MTRIKQLLLLGGLFEIIFSILALFGNPLLGAINAIAFLIFVVLAIVFLFKKKVAFAHRFAQKHGNISAYLYALGWLPYFTIPYTIITTVIIYKAVIATQAGLPYVPSNPELLRTYIIWHNLVFFWGLILSLLLATVYVLRNLYLSRRKAPKAKANAAANNPGKKGVIIPACTLPAKRNVANQPGKKGEIVPACTQKAKSVSKKSPAKKGKIRRAPALPAKSVAQKAPVKEEIRSTKPTRAKRDAQNEPVKKEIRRAKPLAAKHDLKPEPGKKEIRRAAPLKLKK